MTDRDLRRTRGQVWRTLRQPVAAMTVGWTLGKIFDANGSKVFGYGLLAFAALLMSLAFVHDYAWILIVSFAVGALWYGPVFGHE